MSIQKQQNHIIVRNERFIELAENLKPQLNETIVEPPAIVEIKSNKDVIHGWKLNDSMKIIF
jgi:alpha-L-rhamnosidase